jgi:hypothetical protein
MMARPCSKRHTPFAGYERRPRARYGEPACDGPDTLYPVGDFGADSGLTPAQAWVARERLEWAIRRRQAARLPIDGWWFAAAKAGVTSAVKRGLVGNRDFGRRLRRQKGGRHTVTWYRSQLRAWGARGGQAKAERGRKARVFAALSPRLQAALRARRFGASGPNHF